AVREAGRNPQLAMIVLAQLDTGPAPETRRAAAQVNRHVEHPPAYDAHQLALGLLQLVVQPAQHTARRARVVVLHEIDIEPGQLTEGARVPALEEKAARVAEHLGLEQQHLGQCSGGRLHQNTRSSSRRSRYWP